MLLVDVNRAWSGSNLLCHTGTNRKRQFYFERQPLFICTQDPDCAPLIDNSFENRRYPVFPLTQLHSGTRPAHLSKHIGTNTLHKLT